MNPLSLGTEEGSSYESSSGSNRQQPADRPSPFLMKTYDFVDDPSTDQVVSWCQETSNGSFVIWDPRTFSMSVLPKYFKHNNFSNFVRQLNSYGFKKVNPDRWEFANASFIRGQRHLMTNNIKRRTTQNPEYTCPKFEEETDFNKEIHKLRRDKELLMTELVNLRQLQKTTRGQIRSMEQRLRKTELKQQQTTRFLASAVRNPEFLRRLRRTNDAVSEGGECGKSGVCSVTENEVEGYVDICEFEVLDLDLEMEMEMSVVVPSMEKEGQEELVGEFLNDWIKEELRIVNVEEDEYHVHHNMF